MIQRSSKRCTVHGHLEVIKRGYEWKLPLRGQITYRHCRQPRRPNFLYSSNTTSWRANNNINWHLCSQHRYIFQQKIAYLRKYSASSRTAHSWLITVDFLEAWIDQKHLRVFNSMTFNRLDSGQDSLCADKGGAQNLKHHTGSAEMSVSSLIEQ